MREMRDEPSRWRTLGERVIYDNPWVWLGQIDVEIPGGERFWHHVVRLHRAAVMVLADDQDRVMMLWRHRFVQDRWGWSCPAAWSMRARNRKKPPYGSWRKRPATGLAGLSTW